MNELTLHAVKCLDDEDRRGDECRLVVRSDDRIVGVYRRNMDDGDTWPLGLRFLYEDNCSITLHDEETLKPDDSLGQIRLGPAGREHSTIVQIQDDPDALYEVSYTMAPVAASRLAAADRAIADWKGHRQAGPWDNMPRNLIIGQVEARVRDPKLIRQQGASLCGPIAVLYELARVQPERYVRMCREMWQTGKLEMMGETIDAPRGLLEDGIGRGMEEVDWMMAATIRNEENSIARVRSDSFNGLSGYTLSGAMKTWSRGLLGATAVQDISTERGGELAAIRRADEIVTAGGSAFLQIEAAMIKGGSDRRHMYNHWVAYDGGLVEKDDQIKFRVYSWGRVYDLEMSVQRFKDTFHGTVVASGIPHVGSFIPMLDLSASVILDRSHLWRDVLR